MEIMIQKEEAHVLSQCLPFKTHGTTLAFCGSRAPSLEQESTNYDPWAKSSLSPAFGQCVQNGVVIFKRLGEKSPKERSYVLIPVSYMKFTFQCP